ncbi:hypothetical protein QTH90_30920 [Variovorax sp. J2P1-59]|uniref:hypothetical protein n=1 Tax=Variovorax flavidus TaxID=3053501 RepID=UPI002576D90D|nr:hypothetical protein [Variovorax sp. J2P1-59]MDM0078854.1 hypothetical protein [Variovorax sp. J2P1-59]
MSAKALASTEHWDLKEISGELPGVLTRKQSAAPFRCARAACLAAAAFDVDAVRTLPYQKVRERHSCPLQARIGRLAVHACAKQKTAGALLLQLKVEQTRVVF